MKIGIDCRMWSQTGVGRYIQNLVRALSEIDRKNEYILFLRQEEFEKVVIPSENFSKRATDIRWHTLAEQLKYPPILIREKLDLVHFPYFSVPIFYPGKFIVTIHDLILHHFPTGQASTLPAPLYWLKIFGYQYVIQKAADHAGQIITVSESTRNEVVDHLKVSEKKISVIPEGVEEMFLRGSERPEKNHFGINRYFLYVGNTYPHKNVNRLIEAFGQFRLKTNDEQIKLVLVGPEDFFSRRTKEFANDLFPDESVVFMHNVSDYDLLSLYQNALALFLPSKMEGFGFPALEALASGCLVACSNIPAFHELCKDTALYFDPNNKRQIAETMLSIYSKGLKSFEKKIQYGRKRAKLFTWQSTALETVKIYNRCASKS